MKRPIPRFVLAALTIAFLTGPSLWAQDAALRRPAPQPLMQVAILLDTSNSMDGLIDQAKTQLWRIVNELAKAKQDGRSPELQVALYEYGNDGLSRDTGHIRQVLSLTTDLDKVSQELFALRTNGGSEYCGQVIQTAINQLSWVGDKNAYRAIFIAGNEPFTQGGVAYAEACKQAAAKGVVVNTIFCGSETEGINTKWRDGATLAGGSFMNIDQNQAVVRINAPQDAEIAKLGVDLNSTYVAVGRAGAAGAANQVAQDANAVASSPAVAAERAVSKASAVYKADWDLIDSVQSGKVKLADVKEEELPEAMRTMTPQERQKYVDEQVQKRQELQGRIAELNKQRQQYIDAEMKKRSEQGEKTLDTAMIETLRAQAQERQFQF